MPHSRTPGGRLYARRYVPGRNFNPGNCFTGELTPRGVWQQLQNGALLRQRYVDSGFLPSDGEAALPYLYLRADDVPRVILSAESLLLGFFPPSNRSTGICSTSAPWQIALQDIGLENMFVLFA